jgi:formate dehydrogenase major subunit
MVIPLERRPREQWTDRERFFHDYLTRYTNALTRINEQFKDTEVDLAGVFSGRGTWNYEGVVPKEIVEADDGAAKTESEPYSDRVEKLVGKAPQLAETLADPNCVFSILRKHYKRYDVQMVEDVCGTPRDVFLRVAETLWANAGPERTGAICYAVGWTQHSTGVQMIRTAAILQLLLGNIGRPGGGILALRGHATIQGSTDIATLYNIHPGYLNTPDARKKHRTLDNYIDVETSATSYWSNLPAFMVSQLKAWFGDVPANEAYNMVPKIIGDHSHMPMFVEMHKGNIKGFFAMGQNPAVGGQNASFQRQALAKLDWLVVRDLYETETATFWKDSPEVKNGTLKPENIDTEVFLMPAAAVAEGDGSFTNTQRLAQWHHKAVDPPGDARTDLWFTVHLGRRLQAMYRRDGKEPRDRAIRSLVWDYFDGPEDLDKIGDQHEPSARLVLKEINGYFFEKGKRLKDATPLAKFADIKDNGSTACGAWIYTGMFAPTEKEKLGHNHAANRHGDSWVSLSWGFSWPANRRLMYNRCSADPDGRPWPKEARLARPHGHDGYVYWDVLKEEWVGLDVPDFAPKKKPSAEAKEGKAGLDAHDGASPFIMKADGKGWLFVPAGLVDGPLPTHYEPIESPVKNAVYPKQQNNPVALRLDPKDAAGKSLNPVAEQASSEYPHVLSTYRLTEHHLSGSMSRWLPWLVELMPELFCELSPEHAAEIGVGNTDWVRITTPRGTIRAKALVTRRIRSFRVKDDKEKDGYKSVHHVGLPWHWGYKGLSKGDVVNDLSALVGDPNVSIHEAKVFVCNVTKG